MSYEKMTSLCNDDRIKELLEEVQKPKIGGSSKTEDGMQVSYATHGGKTRTTYWKRKVDTGNGRSEPRVGILHHRKEDLKDRSCQRKTHADHDVKQCGKRKVVLASVNFPHTEYSDIHTEKIQQMYELTRGGKKGTTIIARDFNVQLGRGVAEDNASGHVRRHTFGDLNN